MTTATFAHGSGRIIGRFLRAAVSRSPLAWALIGVVRGWRAVLSPLYGDVCKFYPTCSSYGLTALETHGAIKGSWLTVRRLVRCHPWSLGGYDPVPGAEPHLGHGHPPVVPDDSDPDADPASPSRGSQR
ncbi:MAG: membrane protein insertion efficiency factor YidD [Propionibacterium sp.]|nr:membrane protein insertion efficiency factor YidD [Propionibacterium sp.]